MSGHYKVRLTKQTQEGDNLTLARYRIKDDKGSALTTCLLQKLQKIAPNSTKMKGYMYTFTYYEYR